MPREKHLQKSVEIPHSDFLIDITGENSHYLEELLFEFGAYKDTPNGAIGFEIADLLNIQKVLNIEFELWEILALQKMSAIYANQLNGTKDTPFPINGGIMIDREKFDRIMNG